MAKRKSTRRRPVVRVKHVLNSLTQIEGWVHALREALGGLDPDQELTLKQKPLRIKGRPIDHWSPSSTMSLPSVGRTCPAAD